MRSILDRLRTSRSRVTMHQSYSRNRRLLTSLLRPSWNTCSMPRSLQRTFTSSRPSLSSLWSSYSHPTLTRTWSLRGRLSSRSFCSIGQSGLNSSATRLGPKGLRALSRHGYTTQQATLPTRLLRLVLRSSTLQRLLSSMRTTTRVLRKPSLLPSRSKPVCGRTSSQLRRRSSRSHQ